MDWTQQTHAMTSAWMETQQKGVAGLARNGPKRNADKR